MTVRILEGDALAVLPSLESESVQMIGPTSPPYLNLRSYLPAGHPDKGKEIGGESTPEQFIEALVAAFRECRRVLRNDGIFVLNLGDSMTGSGKGPTGHNGIGNQSKRQGFTDVKTAGGLPPKNLLMIPFRVALALQADGWILRSVIPWLKRNGMPESADDRPTMSVEYLFFFAKQGRYYWDSTAIRQTSSYDGPPKPGRQALMTQYGGKASMALGVGNPAGRNFRNSDLFFKTWQGLLLDEDGDPLALIVNPKGSPLAHFASFPDALVDPFMRAGTSERGCCPACRAPWVRVVERTTPPDLGRGQQSWTNGATVHPQRDNCGGLHPVAPKHLGWAPSCTCIDAGDPVPCVVLDPFAGTFTTSLVAGRLGRDSIGIDLSPAYCEIGRKRIANDCPMLTQDAVTVESTERQVPLLLEAR